MKEELFSQEVSLTFGGDTGGRQQSETPSGSLPIRYHSEIFKSALRIDVNTLSLSNFII